MAKSKNKEPDLARQRQMCGFDPKEITDARERLVLLLARLKEKIVERERREVDELNCEVHAITIELHNSQQAGLEADASHRQLFETYKTLNRKWSVFNMRRHDTEVAVDETFAVIMTMIWPVMEKNLDLARQQMLQLEQKLDRRTVKPRDQDRTKEIVRMRDVEHLTFGQIAIACRKTRGWERTARGAPFNARAAAAAYKRAKQRQRNK